MADQINIDPTMKVTLKIKSGFANPGSYGLSIHNHEGDQIFSTNPKIFHDEDLYVLPEGINNCQLDCMGVVSRLSTNYSITMNFLQSGREIGVVNYPEDFQSKLLFESRHQACFLFSINLREV